MPHLIIEYSANIEAELELHSLMQKLYTAAVDTGVFPAGGIRVRGARRDQYVIADDHPDNAFVHLFARIRHGRPLAIRRQAGEQLFGVLCEHLQALFDRIPLGISFDIQEIDPDTSWKKNNLHDYLKQRQGPQ